MNEDEFATFEWETSLATPAVLIGRGLRCPHRTIMLKIPRTRWNYFKTCLPSWLQKVFVPHYKTYAARNIRVIQVDDNTLRVEGDSSD